MWKRGKRAAVSAAEGQAEEGQEGQVEFWEEAAVMVVLGEELRVQGSQEPVLGREAILGNLLPSAPPACGSGCRPFCDVLDDLIPADEGPRSFRPVVGVVVSLVCQRMRLMRASDGSMGRTKSFPFDVETWSPHCFLVG